jgi:diguanylate cyclase (GGDEF)-like protein
MLAATLADEAGRQSALHRYDLPEDGQDRPFARITALVRTVLGVPMCAITFIEADRQLLRARQGMTLGETSRDDAFCDHTIRSFDPMVIPDAMLDQRFAEHRLVLNGTVRAYAGVPLTTSDGYNLGALCVIDDQARQFLPADVELLQRFAALVMSELEWRKIAHEDALTGTMTRRAFMEECRRAIAHHARYERRAALIVFDIDHFKSINDTFGHPAGDDVLRAVAAACSAALRPSDSFGRIGGEEFAVLLPETDRAAALACAERLRAAVAGVSVDACRDRPITASFGVCSLRQEMRSEEQWVAEADAALYMAKRGGRNRCIESETLTLCVVPRPDPDRTI